MIVIKEMYANHLEFISFPAHYIIVQDKNGEDLTPKFIFIPKDISKIAKVREDESPIPKQYEITMNRELNELILQVISDRCHVKYQINAQD